MNKQQYLELLAKQIKDYAQKEGIDIGDAIARMRARMKDDPRFTPDQIPAINAQFKAVQELI